MATNTSASRRFQIVLRKHTGILVLMRTQTIRLQGTLEQLEAAYRSAQRHNYVAGWWGVLSLLCMNWIAILSNRSAMASIRQLAAAP
jgi:hypothetical protein